MQKTMPSLRTFVLLVPYLIFSIVHLVALWMSNDDLSRFTKPLLMLSLLAGALFALPLWRSLVTLLAAFALLFSWAGDVGIAAPGDTNFLIALGSFLIAHLFYIALFLGKLGKRRMSPWSVIYLAWWVGLVVILAPHIGAMLIPVAVYGLVLGVMGAFALNCNVYIAVGGALFVVSDSILGLNKFLPGFELWQVHFLIMLSYLAAQGLIVFGIIRWAWTKGTKVATSEATGDSVAGASASEQSSAAPETR